MENASSNGALMRRIVQLEKERDELQKDIEAMCLQQAGVAGSVDIGTRMQARRAASLEQELESSKEKTNLLSRENHNLQEELSEAYRLKSHLTEAFKRAVEKNNQLEKEVKFYQSKVAAAFSERDKAFVEVERVQEAEKVMTAKFHQLQNRVEEADRESKEHEAEKMELQQKHEAEKMELQQKHEAEKMELQLKYEAEKVELQHKHESEKLELQHTIDTNMAQLDTLYKVVEKFWRFREGVHDDGQSVEPLDRATALLSESDDQWAYGGSLEEELKQARALADEIGALAKEKELRATELDAQLLKLKEEVEASTLSLQKQLEEKEHAHQVAAEKASNHEIQLANLQRLTISKVMEVRTDHEDIRTRVDSVLEDEKRWIDSMVTSFEALLSELKASEAHPEIVDKYEENRSPPEEEEAPSPQEDPSPSEPVVVLEEIAEPSETYHELSAELSRAVDLEEEPHTSQETSDELERPASSQNQSLPESILPESSLAESSGISVVASSVQPEAHPVAESNDDRVSEEEPCSAVVTLSRRATDMAEDDRKALAQALHEKVEALLLLSQQEERYYMESKTIQGLEFQIKDLNEKICQVTNEKVSALMEVAQLRHNCQRLEEREKELIRRLQMHRSTNAGGRLLPAAWSESNVAAPESPRSPRAVSEKQIVVPKPITTSGYLKSWLRGLDMSGAVASKAAAAYEPIKESVGTSSSKSQVDTNEPVDLAKLRVENAALQERIAGVQRLTESAHRLRTTLFKVSTDVGPQQQSPESLHSALEIVEGVRRESNHLRIALGCSLPVSRTPESPTTTTTTVDGESSDGDVDVGTAAGIEMVELLLVACGMQRAALQRQIDFPSVDTGLRHVD